GDVADVVALAAGHDVVAVGADDAGRAAPRRAWRGAGRNLARRLGRDPPRRSGRHVDRPRFAVERAHARADAAEVLVAGGDRRLSGNEHEADFAIACLAPCRFAGAELVEVKADIVPPGAFGRHPDDAMLVIGCVLAEMKSRHRWTP